MISRNQPTSSDDMIVKFGKRLFTAHPHVARYILFETRTGDEKDDNNSLQRFGVLHLLQRERNNVRSATDPSISSL